MTVEQLPWLAGAWERFRSAYREQRLGHAYLLQAPAGTGKQLLAHAMQALALCLEPDDGVACGQCRSCALLKSGAHPDQRTLTFEPNEKGVMRKEIVVAQVRRLMSSMQMTATMSPRLAACVVPAEGMNLSAANALLKTLEEPAGQALLVLVSHDPRRLPPTIRSRCQLLRLRLPTRPELAQWVAEQAGTGSEQAGWALAATHGRPLQALDALQDGSVERFQSLGQMLGQLLDGGTGVPQVAAELGEHDPHQVWGWLSGYCADAIKKQALGQQPKWASRDLRPMLHEIADLQLQADRNRRMSASPIRQDLLLQSWLIEWSRLGTSSGQPSKRQTATGTGG